MNIMDAPKETGMPISLFIEDAVNEKIARDAKKKSKLK
jgi:hypothetical protein